MSQPVVEGAEPHRPRVGRPPRISRDMIAEAAHEVGLEGLTLKAVAEHLEVSVAALYHHVSGKDDLMRLAAEVSMRSVPLPVDRGQHWAVWLLEWARYNHDVFVSQPALLAQYLEGAIATEVIAERTERILEVLVRAGFEAHEAMAAYELISSSAIGAAAAHIRERSMAARGQRLAGEYRRVLAERPPEELVHLRRMLATPGPDRVQSFDDRITTVLVGVASRRGISAGEVVEALGDEAGRRR
jgi:AcrR family transcriptional regulator